MATIEDLNKVSIEKLAKQGGTRSDAGRFIFPTELINEWYQKSKVPSVFRGLVLRSDAVLDIINPRSEAYRVVEVMLTEVGKQEERAHRLPFHRLSRYEMISTIRRGYITTIERTTPTPEDLDAFIGFIENADDYNLLIPYSPPANEARTTGGIILPKYRRPMNVG